MRPCSRPSRSPGATSGFWTTSWRPHLKTLDSFDFAFQPSLDRSRMTDLFALSFLARKENVLFLGPPGVGKTHLAVALAVAACKNGSSVYFTTLDQIIRSLAAADRAGKLEKKIRTYSRKSQLLVIDEVGYLPLSRAEANYLFQVVSQRYERSSLILTFNKSFTEWPAVFGDHAMATAILDRLFHHAQVFSIKGNSYRLRERVAASLPQETAAPTDPTERRTALRHQPPPTHVIHFSPFLLARFSKFVDTPTRNPLSGRPRSDTRRIVPGIFSILDNAAKRKNTPSETGSKRTVDRWFQKWVEAGESEALMRHAGR